jgi:alanyl-tRNA synthetase
VFVSTVQPLLVVVAAAADAGFAANAVLKTLIERFGGRGGGKPELAQAGGVGGTADELLDAARSAIVAASR